ncbi:MAG: aspartate/glutamate racemase family protein [Planctomycetota bacterium]
MSRHIGIVACSAEGAALCYRTICNEGPRRIGEHDHPEITLHNHSLATYMPAIRRGDWREVADFMLDSARIVAEAGAEFAVSPDNTIHEAFGMVEAESPLPWLHIARVVGREARRRGLKRLGVLGTKYLMTGPVYPEALEPMGIGTLIPAPEERERIDRIIFEELVNAEFTEESRRYFNRVMEGLKARGADAAVLGCTEIPLLVIPEEAPLPTLDSTRLLARAALDRAIG